MKKEVRRYKVELFKWKLKMVKYNYHHNMAEFQCDVKGSWYGIKKLGIWRTLNGEHYTGEFPEGFFDRIWERHF